MLNPKIDQVKEQISPKSIYKLHFDGASKQNPGPSGIGYSISDQKGKEIYFGAKFIGQTTNNVAEYNALIAGMKAAIQLGIKKLMVYGDSKLVLSQTDPNLSKNWKVNQDHLKPLSEQVKALTSDFESIFFNWVPREKNQRADELSNIGIKNPKIDNDVEDEENKNENGTEKQKDGRQSDIGKKIFTEEVNSKRASSFEISTLDKELDKAYSRPEKKVKSDESYNLYFDGASKSNPGPAGIGYSIENSLKIEIKCGSEFIGKNTNNVAEYRALIAGLKAAIDIGIKKLNVYGDSQLVINQTDPNMPKNWKVKQEHLKSLNQEAKDLAKKFEKTKFEWVPREQNKRADELSNQKLFSR